MVLDDASPQAGSFSRENAPTGASSKPSSAKTYSPSMFNHLRIKPELFVHPDLFTLYFGYFGTKSWKLSIAERVAERLLGTWVLTGRTVTQEELDAFCIHTSRSSYYGRIGIPIATFGGGIWMYRQIQRETPGLTPSQRLSNLAHIFRHQSSVFWSIMARMGFRMLFIGSVGAMVSSIASAYSDMSSLLTDPRLEQWRQDSKNQKDEDIRKRKLEIANEGYRLRQSSKLKIKEQMEGDFSKSGTGDTAFEEPQMQQEQYSYVAPAENQSTYDSSQSQYQSSSPVYGSKATPQSQQADTTDFFLGGSQDDDASPTAAEYRNTNPDGSAMSAWDRVRAQNAPPRSQPTPRQSTGWAQAEAQSPSADSAPAGNRDRYDYDRRREKEQAQVDFDKMMDNERNASEGSTRRGWGS